MNQHFNALTFNIVSDAVSKYLAARFVRIP